MSGSPVILFFTPFSLNWTNQRNYVHPHFCDVHLDCYYRFGFRRLPHQLFTVAQETDKENRMKYLSKTFILCCLVSTAVLLWQFGCSSTPQETASTQATPSPSATIEAAATTQASPTPTAEVATVAPYTPSKRSSAAASSSAPSRASAGAAAPSEPAYERPKPPPPPPPRTYTLRSGSVISIFTDSDLSTKTSRNGERFTASLGRAITDGDWVIAKKGAPVEGVIVNADPGGRVSGVASIAVRLESITLADGRRVNISTDSYTKQAKSSKKKDAAKIGIGAGIGAAIGAIAGGGKGAAIGAGVGGAGGTGVVLGTRGDAAVIPSESQLTFRLTDTVTITKR